MEAGALRRLTIGVRCRFRGVVFVASFSWRRFRGGGCSLILVELWSETLQNDDCHSWNIGFLS
jgi:hypothetical protein